MEKISNLLKKLKSMWKTPLKDRYMNLKEMTNFGMYALGLSFIMSAVNYVATISFLPYVYQIDTIHAYAIVTISSLIAVIMQPIIGNLIERTKSKWGKYKPFILCTFPLFAIFAVLVTWVPQFALEKNRIIYAYISCVPVLVLSSFSNNMYQTMPTVVTPNAQERSDIMTPIGLIFGFAPSILQIVAGPIRAYYSRFNQEYMAMRLIGIISVSVGVVLMLMIIKVKERVYNSKVQEGEEEKLNMGTALKMLAKNAPLWILCLALILGSLRDFTGQFRWMIIQFRFAENTATAKIITGIPLTIIGFASTVSMVLLPIVTRKLSKNVILIIFTTLSVVGNAVLGFIGYENIPIGMTSVIVVTIIHFLTCISPAYLLIPIMLGEIADYQQSLTHKRLEGHLQNFIFTIPGLFTQILMMSTIFIQKRIGFEAKNYTEASILTDIQQIIACNWFNAVSIISAISGVLMIIVLFFYPLSKKKHLAVIEKIKAGATLTVDCEATELTEPTDPTEPTTEDITL